MPEEDHSKIESAALLIGRRRQVSVKSDDISNSKESQTLSRDMDDVIALGGESNLLTIAPTAAARMRSCVIPNLLTYPGSIVVVDLTGEAYTATSRARREMGQAVVRLDPFRVIDGETDAINPLDLLQGLEGAAVEPACQDIAALLPGFHSFDDVWENAAFGLLTGVIGYLSAVPDKRRFSDIYATLHTDDVVYSLAVVLDTIGKKIPPIAYSEISVFLQKADLERSRILTSLTSQLKAFGSKDAQKTLSASTIPLTDIVEGKPTTVYLMIPSTKLTLHLPLLRVWIGTLLLCVMAQNSGFDQPTLFLLDECAKLGSFPQLEAAITATRNSRFRIWTFWQDLRELRVNYPGSWLLNNCEAIQVFGSRDYSANEELATLLGVEPAAFRSLAVDEQFIYREGVSNKAVRLDYLADRFFAGRFDRNSSNQNL